MWAALIPLIAQVAGQMLSKYGNKEGDNAPRTVMEQQHQPATQVPQNLFKYDPSSMGNSISGMLKNSRGF